MCFLMKKLNIWQTFKPMFVSQTFFSNQLNLLDKLKAKRFILTKVKRNLNRTSLTSNQSSQNAHQLEIYALRGKK